ncbi:hypothetical protein [Mesorhizobium sp. CAU 1741]
MRGLLMAYFSFGFFGSEADASAGRAVARARFTKTTAKTTTAKTV